MENNLSDILIKEGLTNAELSRISGVNAMTISKLKNGKAPKAREVTKGKIVRGINQHVGNEKYALLDVFPSSK